MNKFNITIVVVALILLTACENKEVKRLKEENQRLYLEIETRDKTVNDMFKSFNEIEDNLAQIRAKEMLIKRASSIEISENDTNVRNRITEEIQLINQLIEENKKTIKRLREQMRTSNLKITELEKTIAQLTKQIDEKDSEIADLKSRLEQMHFRVDELNLVVEKISEEKEVQKEVIAQQTEEINEVWYAFGTRNELVTKNIITREGGIVGIGRSSRISENINTEYFTRIDLRKTTEITLKCNEARLLSTHPAGTWEFIMSGKTIESLKIKDPKKFWSITKYLVIEIK